MLFISRTLHLFYDDKEQLMAQLQEVLDDIVDGPSITFASVLTTEGLVVENSNSVANRDGMVASATCEMLGIADSIGKHIGAGECRGLFMRLSDMSVLVEKVMPGVVLIVGVDDEQNIEDIRYIVKKSIPQLQQRM